MSILTAKLARDTGSLATDNITNLATISGTADSLAIITVLDGLTVIGTAFADALGAWSFTPSPSLADGSHTLTVSETAAGITTTDSVTFILDTVAPVVTAVLTTDTGSSTSDGISQSAIINGTGEANAVVTVMEGATILGTAIADTTGAWKFDPNAVNPTTLPDGLHLLTVTETDLAGNIGSDFVSLVLDTKAQPAVISSVTGSDALTTVNGIGEAGSALILLDGTTAIGTTTVRTDGSWTLAPSLALGIHQLSVQEVDLAGNTATTAARAFTVGTPAPDLDAASDSGQSSTDNITNINKPKLTGSGMQANATVQLFDSVTTAAGLVIPTVALGSPVKVDAFGNWTLIPSTKLVDGAHSITAQQTVGTTVSAASAALLVTIDTAAPAKPSKPSLTTVSDSGSSSSDNLTNVITPTFSGTADAGSLVQVFDRVSVTVNKVTTRTDTLIASITAAADGTWTTPNSIPLSDGAHSMLATATDVAGNTSAESGLQSITIDTIAPAPTFSGMAVNGNASITLTGAVETGAVVSIFDLNKNLGTATPGKTAGTWTFTTATNLTDTLHVFLTRAVDAAGNIGAIAGQNGSAQFGSTLDDVLKSTIGNDVMTGGTGNDTFAFLSDFGKDAITDFHVGTAALGHDTINFHADSVLNSFASVVKNAKSNGSDTVITQDAGNALTLKGVTDVKSLIAVDFTFN